MNFPMIAGYLRTRAIMAEPAAAAGFLEALGPSVFGAPLVVDGRPRDDMGVVGAPLRTELDCYDWKPRTIGDTGCSVIEAEGVLVNKGKWIGKYCGETSYEGIMAQAAICRDDPAVKGVILEVDSYGGMASMAFECADAIHALAKEKPVLAVLTDAACSAGYLLASAAGAIVMPETGTVGSIGVVRMHVSAQKWLENEGYKVTFIHAGARKVDGNPYQDIPEDVLSRMEADVEAARGKFAATVARYRAGRLSEKDALATEADCYSGLDDQAVKLGLVDAIGNPIEAAEEFVASLKPAA